MKPAAETRILIVQVAQFLYNIFGWRSRADPNASKLLPLAIDVQISIQMLQGFLLLYMCFPQKSQILHEIYEQIRLYGLRL